MEKIGVLCLEDNKPSIVEYYEITDDMINLRDERGELLYSFGVILNYMFNIEVLKSNMHKRMPLHIVEKKIPYIDENAQLVKPEAPNGYKFETLILDMVHMVDSCLSFEVDRKKEFAPIKNKEGVDSVESARELLSLNGVEL
jgi:UDP-N-acetylglucosamine/UDP-N-acetylgalactosamine diphosphorylase